VTPRGESASSLTTGAWGESGIESLLQRLTNEDTQRRVFENSDTISVTIPLVEDVASQVREGHNSTSNSIGSTVEASSGAIIPMYSRPSSQDAVTSTPLSSGGGDAQVPGCQCHMPWYRMEVLLSQYTLYGELCCVAESLNALAEYAQTANHFSSPPLSLVGSNGTSQCQFKHFQNWWATRKPFCGTKDAFPRAPLSLHHDGSQAFNGVDSNESRLKLEARNRAKEIHLKLQTEWMNLVVWLSALAAVDSAIFALTLESADTVVSPAARTMIIASGICAVFGILLVTWFIWKFCWTSGVALGDFDEFMVRITLLSPLLRTYTYWINHHSAVLST
ncbi:hypothetical protein AAF712_015608, partial [Marasmius tenuissimus]